MSSIFKQFLTIVTLVFTIVACDTLDERTDINTTLSGKHAAKMIFKGSVAGYDGASIGDVNTKGSVSWSEGDAVYIAFHSGDAIIPGSAVYSSSEGWMVYYEGDLLEGASQQCEVRYFVNPTLASESLVTLNPNTEIYEDIEGEYTYSGGYVTVDAILIPKVGRIRFTGNTGDKIHITGITTNKTFSPASNKFTTTAAVITLEVEEAGSTPYVYGFFTYDDRKLGLVGSDFAYTRTCGSNVFRQGDSGYMKIPSSSSHNNWRTGLMVSVNGVDFKMLPVTGYSTGFFLLAETETTEAQYQAISGSSSTSLLPKSATWDAWKNFISSLNYLTSLNFFVPSINQWRYAAQGGTLSQGYTYAGSNTPGDVAWYLANSGNSLHQVKELAPNELGFYDMSGNAPEWTSSTNKDSKYWRQVAGGRYSSSENQITIQSLEENRIAWDGNGGAVPNGLRLALKLE